MKLHFPTPVVVLQMRDGSQALGWLIGECRKRDKLRISAFHDGATYCDGQWYDMDDIERVYFITEGAEISE